MYPIEYASIAVLPNLPQPPPEIADGAKNIHDFRICMAAVLPHVLKIPACLTFQLNSGIAVETHIHEVRAILSRTEGNEILVWSPENDAPVVMMSPRGIHGDIYRASLR